MIAAGACVTACAVGAIPASVHAASTTGAPPTVTVPTTAPPAPTTTTAAPAPRPAPAQGSAKLYLGGLFSVAKEAVTVPGRDVRVTGVVRPYIPRQRVLVQAMQGGRVFAHKLVWLRASKQKVYGGFTVTFRTPKAGLVAVVLKHSRSAGLSAFGAERHLDVLSESVSLGSTGRFVQLLQAKLAARHLYLPRTGVFDQGTELALDAYHRLLGWGEGHESVTVATIGDLLNGKGSFHVRFPGQGHHAEGDLSDQVLALADGSKVQMLFPISSGKPSTPTVLGSWQIYSRQPGYLPDGMYYSSFFIRGFAIHGYDPAPDYPASHGCMRLPIVDAVTAFDWLGLGDWVDTYYAG